MLTSFCRSHCSESSMNSVSVSHRLLVPSPDGVHINSGNLQYPSALVTEKVNCYMLDLLKCVFKIGIISGFSTQYWPPVTIWTSVGRESLADVALKGESEGPSCYADSTGFKAQERQQPKFKTCISGATKVDWLIVKDILERTLRGSANLDCIKCEEPQDHGNSDLQNENISRLSNLASSMSKRKTWIHGNFKFTKARRVSYSCLAFKDFKAGFAC